MTSMLTFESIKKTLLKRYMVMVIPAALVCGIWAALKNTGMALLPEAIFPEFVGPAMFILAIALAVGLPILIRAKFAQKVGTQQEVDGSTFVAFQSNLITIALSAPYFAATAYICQVSLFHFAGSFLAALYAVYYYFPSESRLRHDMRIFRVQTGTIEGNH